MKESCGGVQLRKHTASNKRHGSQLQKCWICAHELHCWCFGSSMFNSTRKLRVCDRKLFPAWPTCKRHAFTLHFCRTGIRSATATTATIQFELTYPTPEDCWTLITTSTIPTTSTTTSTITYAAATTSASSILFCERTKSHWKTYIESSISRSTARSLDQLLARSFNPSFHPSVAWSLECSILASTFLP